MGEKFTSLKQLLSRYSRVATSIIEISASGFFSIWPWFIGASSGASAPDNEAGQLYADYYSRFATGYAMARGSMRIMISTEGPFVDVTVPTQVNTPVHVSMPIASAETGIIINAGVDNDTSVNSNNVVAPLSAVTSPAVVAFAKSTDGVEVLAPHYNQCPSRINYVQYASTEVRSNTYWTPKTYFTFNFETGSITSIKRLFRSLGEDGQLGYFIGFLPLLINHELTPVPP